ncbi:MAG: hypothetical protein AAGH87_04520 [Pseudomonadota bacterium]
MWGTQVEGVAWLEHQLTELDQWRQELVDHGPVDNSLKLEELDSHRDWLERRIADLSRGRLSPV